MDERRLDVDGVPMRWMERGDGYPAVVLLHGFLTGPLLWRHVAMRIDGSRCLALELVGFGESAAAGAERDISLRAQADYLVAWLRALDIGPVLLVGHDIGGGVAQIAAARRPELCAGLLLVGSVGQGDWPNRGLRALRTMAPLIRRMPNAALHALVGSWLRRGHDDILRGRASAELHWRAYANGSAGAALARQLRALKARDIAGVTERLAGLGLPVRLVWGAADRIRAISKGERLAQELGAPLHRIAGARHFVPEDHPDALAEDVLALLAAAGTGPATRDPPDTAA